MNFDNIFGLIFLSQNFLIPLSPKIPQRAKCPNTPILCTTHNGKKFLWYTQTPPRLLLEEWSAEIIKFLSSGARLESKYVSDKQIMSNL